MIHNAYGQQIDGQDRGTLRYFSVIIISISILSKVPPLMDVSKDVLKIFEDFALYQETQTGGDSA